MADNIEFSLTGIDGLLGKLDSLKYETRYKGGRFALRKAAQVVREAAKQNALTLDDAGTGRSIAQNITEKWNGREYKRTGNLAFRVGVQHGAKLPKDNKDEGAGGPTPHWRLLEFGTERMAAKPFMRPALENNISAATDEFIKQYEKAIDRAIKKAAKGK